MSNLAMRLSHIRYLFLDVDGIFTNGTLHYNEDGELFKSFHVHDGLGIKLLKKYGITVAIVTARQTPILTRRFNELGIEHVIQGQHNKLAAFEQLCSQFNTSAEHIAYMGDDIQDLCILTRAGVGITVPNATSAVAEHCAMVTIQHGGQGAVREVCEAILKAQGHWNDIVTNAINTGSTT